MPKKNQKKELACTQQERNQQVIRSVHLIQNARYSLTLQEQRFLLYCISKVKPTDTVETVYSIELKDYLNVCGLRGTTTYDNLKKSIVKTLEKMKFQMEESDVRGNKYFMVYNWFSKMGASTRGVGAVRYQFTQDVAKELINLAQYNENADTANKLYYISDELKYMLPFKCRYSYYLYPLLRSFQNRDEWTFPIEGPDGLRERLDVFEHISVDEYNMSLDQKAPAARKPLYPRYPDFRRNVLIPAIDDINRYSNIKVSFRPVKHGRSVTAITFLYQDKNAVEKLESEQRGQLIMDRADGTGYRMNPVPDPELPLAFTGNQHTGLDTTPASVTVGSPSPLAANLKDIRREMAAREEQQRRRIHAAGMIPYGKRGPRSSKNSRDGRKQILQYFTFTLPVAGGTQAEVTADAGHLTAYAKACGGALESAAGQPHAAQLLQDFVLWYIDQSAPRRLREYRQNGYITPDSQKDRFCLKVNTKTALEDLQKFMGLYLANITAVEQIFRVYQADAPAKAEISAKKQKIVKKLTDK